MSLPENFPGLHGVSGKLTIAIGKVYDGRGLWTTAIYIRISTDMFILMHIGMICS